MSATQPKVTIGLPVYNEEARIEECLHSLLDQTYSDFKITVFDNCSTDHTPAILQKFAAKDPRITIHRHAENIGALKNFKACLAAGDTPYFKWLAADDKLAPAYIERCVEVLDNDPSIIAAQTGHILFNDEGEVRRVRIGERSVALTWRQVPPMAARGTKVNYFIYGLFRTDLLKATYLHVEPMPALDRWFLTGMPTQSKLYYIDEPLHLRYINQLTFDQRNKADSLARAKQMRFRPLARTVNQNARNLSFWERAHLNLYFLKWHGRRTVNRLKRRKRQIEKRFWTQIGTAARSLFRSSDA